MLTVVCTSCSGGGAVPQETIDRETFVATYVDLRRAMLVSPQQAISDTDRERVLRQNAVTEGDLIAFADAWGGDASYMTGVWEEVGARLARPVATPDSTG
tara:strand:+ start:4392 stop:4691 length:300 start_codon:yes stop_codon:yes gene_type:complete